MRVYDQNLNGASAGQTGSAQEIQRTDRSSGGTRLQGGGSNSDRVEFSNTLGTLSRALGNSQGDRAARVSELAAQFASGQYRLDSAATAHAMVGEAMAPAVQ